ncbi:MAG: ribosome maturation factor RimP [Bacteroidia bacterium]
MVSLVSKLNQWTSDFLQGSDEFLVDVENKEGSTKYRVLVDGMEPITIKRCAMISRYLSKQMEEDSSLDEDDYFTFEVSSPGADRPLKLPKQYYKHIGRQLAIETQEENKISGTLKAVEENKITVAVQVSKKETIEETIEFKNIKEANVIISFK